MANTCSLEVKLHLFGWRYFFFSSKILGWLVDDSAHWFTFQKLNYCINCYSLRLSSNWDAGFVSLPNFKFDFTVFCLTTTVTLQVSEMKGNDVVCTIKNTATLAGSLFTLHVSQIHIDLPTLTEADKNVRNLALSLALCLSYFFNVPNIACRPQLLDYCFLFWCLCLLVVNAKPLLTNLLLTFWWVRIVIKSLFISPFCWI